jgi:hypothetical protein
MSGSIKVGGNTIATHTGAQGAGEVTLGTNIRLPASGGIQDSSGNNILTESGGTITLTADEANVGSNALVVDSSGNVGVGTSSPTQRLQVDGGAFRITGNYTTIANNQGLLLGFNSASDEARYYAVGANGGGVGEHVFYSYNYSTGAGSEQMRIDSSGNVGIGINTPKNKLEVNRLSKLSEIYLGQVSGTQNDNSGAVIIHCFDGAHGHQFAGDFIINSWTGNRFLTLHITARHTDDNIEWTKVSDSFNTNTGKTNVTLSTITVGSFNYLALRKSGGNTGYAYLNAFIDADFFSGDYDKPTEVPSWNYTVVTDHVTF